MDYKNIGYVVMNILSVVGDLVHQHWGVETLSTRTYEYKCCAVQWCPFTSPCPPNTVTIEELTDAYNIAPDSIQIKSGLITITQL